MGSGVSEGPVPRATESFEKKRQQPNIVGR